MFVLPPQIRTNMNVIDQRALSSQALSIDRNREPFHALRRFDPIAVSPAPSVILHVVVKDKTIRFPDLVEVPAPGNIRRLENDAVHTFSISVALNEQYAFSGQGGYGFFHYDVGRFFHAAEVDPCQILAHHSQGE